MMKYRTVLGAMIAAACPQSGQAQSQSASPERPIASPAPSEGTSNADIVVTAQRRTQRLQDVPVAVSVASGATLERGNITTLQQLTARLPAVKIAQTAASDQLFIRGTGSGLNAGFEQSVATFVDGLYRGRARSSRAALFDIEQVEVLKGPQTTFFGNNAIAGAFNITTRKPVGEFGYNASALYAPADHEYNLEAGINVPLTDALWLRVAGRASGMNGYTYNANLKQDEPRLRDLIGRAALRWKPTDGAQVDLRIDVGHNRDRGTFSAELLNCPTPAEFGPVRGACAAYLALRGAAADTQLNLRSDTGETGFRYDFTEVGLTNSFDVGSASLQFVTGYFHHDAATLSQLTPTPGPGVFGAATPFPFLQNERLTQWSQEIRLTSPNDVPLEYIVGAYASRTTLSLQSNFGYFFLPLATLAQPNFPRNVPVTVVVPVDQRDRTISGFGSLTYHITPALKITGSLRYSNVRKSATRSVTAGTSDGPPYFGNFVAGPAAGQAIILPLLSQSAAPFVIGQRTDDKFMPAVNAQYTISRAVMVYASYTKGFKAGGFSASTPDSFRPENVDAYELGLKSTLLNGAATLNLAIFLSNYSDLQESSQIVSPNGVSVSIVGNSAKTRSKGVEANGSLRITRGLSLNADIAYLDSRYVSYPNAPCQTLASLTPGCVQNLAGARRAFSPEFSGSIGANASLPAGHYELRLEPVLSFTSSYFEQSLGDVLYQQPAYAKLDVRIGFADPVRKWELAVVGRNLTNKITASFRSQIATAPGAVSALPDRGRSIALQATIRM